MTAQESKAARKLETLVYLIDGGFKGRRGYSAASQGGHFRRVSSVAMGPAEGLLTGPTARHSGSSVGIGSSDTKRS